MKMRADDPRAVALVEAVRAGDVGAVEHLLADHGELATARFVDPRCSDERSALHLATDWPGHFPNRRAVVARRVEAGAASTQRSGEGTPSGRCTGRPAATTSRCSMRSSRRARTSRRPARSSTAAVRWPTLSRSASGVRPAGSWSSARRPTLWQAAALGLADRVERLLAADPPPMREEITNAFSCACHGGQRTTAERLLERGADIDWIGHDGLTPLDAAVRSDAHELADWLRSRQARSARDLS